MIEKLKQAEIDLEEAQTILESVRTILNRSGLWYASACLSQISSIIRPVRDEIREATQRLERSKP